MLYTIIKWYKRFASVRNISQMNVFCLNFKWPKMAKLVESKSNQKWF